MFLISQFNTFLYLPIAHIFFHIISGNYTLERDVGTELYKHYSENILREYLNVMDEVSNGYMRCDPKEHKEDETYIMLTELLQVSNSFFLPQLFYELNSSSFTLQKLL